MKFLKKLLIWISVAILVIGIGVFWANDEIKEKSKPFISSKIENLPNEKVGLLLGTSKTTKNGYKNWYFYHRITAAEELFKSGKIKYIIVSGDNSQKNYNEPEDMKQELISRGIPAERIYEDFAGFRTLDSVVRAKEIFGQESFIVISQKFHNERRCIWLKKMELKPLVTMPKMFINTQESKRKSENIWLKRKYSLIYGWAKNRSFWGRK